MNQEILNYIVNAMDNATADFLENNEILFNNKNETLKNKYQVINSLKKWKISQKCIVIGCTNKSIKRSHTIQKSASIKSIAEEGHVLTPQFNRESEKIELTLIGINEASTFPGYCQEHERIFEEFENIKDIKNGEHLALQIYRTVCREIVQSKYQIKMSKDFIESYKKLRDKKIFEAIVTDLKAKSININEFEFKNVKFDSNDYRINKFNSQLKSKENYLNGFLLKFHDAILNDIKKKKFQKLAYISLIIDEVIPVAIAGRGNFHVKLKTKIKDVEVIFNVLPFSDRTHIYIFTLKKHTKELDYYMRNCNSGLHLINLIESWMIHGSDHWFLKPSVWSMINKSYQEKIIDSIWDTSKNIGFEFDKTIFNEIKLKAISKFEESQVNQNELYLDFIRKEREKITLANRVDG